LAVQIPRVLFSFYIIFPLLSVARRATQRCPSFCSSALLLRERLLTASDWRRPLNPRSPLIRLFLFPSNAPSLPLLLYSPPAVPVFFKFFPHFATTLHVYPSPPTPSRQEILEDLFSSSFFVFFLLILTRSRNGRPLGELFLQFFFLPLIGIYSAG